MWKAVVVMLALCATSALAQQPLEQSCIPAEAIYAMLKTKPGYKTHTVLSGEQQRLAAEVFAAVKGGKAELWNAATLVEHSDGSGAILVGNGDDLCFVVQLDPDRFRALTNGMFGVPA